jgi:hypothetical protein
MYDVDRVALAEAVHEHRHRAKLQAAGPHPHEVRREARELRHDHAQDLSARRHLDAHQLLHRQRVGQVVDGRGEVVVPVSDHHALLPAQRLHLLLDPGVQVADDRLDAAHLLSVEVDDEPQHSVSGWVMRAEVDRQQLAAEGSLLAGLRDRHALGCGAHASGGGVCHVSCS